MKELIFQKRGMIASILTIAAWMFVSASGVSKATKTEALSNRLSKPIGHLSPRMTSQTNTQGSTLGVNLNVGWTVTPQDIETLAQTGVGWAQVCFSFGPDGRLDWNHNDMLVDHLVKHGIRIMGHIGAMSRFPSIDRELDEGGADWEKPLMNSNTIAAYAMNLALIVDRYKDKIFYWEIWNEIDNSDFWKPKPNAQEYAEVFNLSRNIILTIQPEAKIISGSLTVRYDSPFVEKLITLGVIEKSDFFGFHPPRHLPEYGDGAYSQRQDYDRVMTLLRKANPSILMWDTEIQSLTGTQGKDSQLSHIAHARMMLRRYLVEKDLGYFCTLWQLYKASLAIDHPGQLLTYNSELTEKYFALQNLGAWFDGNVVPAGDRIKIEYNPDTLVLSEEAADPTVCNTPGIQCHGTGMVIDGSLFVPSSMNRSSTYIDMFYISELSEDQMPGFYVLYMDGQAIDYCQMSTTLDSPKNANVWFRDAGVKGGLFVILPKGDSPQNKMFELTNVEASLRHGKQVSVLPSLFRPYPENDETKTFDRYYIRPMTVSPTGISCGVSINGQVWPIAIRALHDYPVNHVSVCNSLEDLVIVTSKGQDISCYHIELQPPRVDNVYTTSYKNSITGDIFICYWQATYPRLNAQIGKIDLQIEGIDAEKLQNPVLVDLMSGKIYDAKQFMRAKGNQMIFDNLPFVDWPLMITNKGAIEIVR